MEEKKTAGKCGASYRKIVGDLKEGTKYFGDMVSQCCESKEDSINVSSEIVGDFRRGAKYLVETVSQSSDEIIAESSDTLKQLAKHIRKRIKRRKED
jgi:hypothetical protein